MRTSLPRWCALALLLMLAAERGANAQQPSFSGAEGFGGTFTGSAPAGGWFSNASIYHVTTTQDLINPSTGKAAVGTLRGAFLDYANPNSPKQQASNRIVVFDVGGTFQLTEGSLDIKTVNNIYVAGQTAPTPVMVYGDLTQITASPSTTNSNVILRYMTFRKGTGNGDDAITFKNGGAAAPSTNMIIDHVSATWSEDEVLSVANFNKNVTVQYSMMTDSLTNGHQYGSLIRPEVDASVTFHHNLYGNDKSRNPRMGSYNNATLTLDFVDNVIYNWSFRAGYAGGGSDSGTPTEKVNVNWVGNYAIAGPATPVGAASTIAVTKDIDGSNPLEFKAYQALNLIDSNHNAVRDGIDSGWGMFQVSNGSALPITDRVAIPFITPPVTTTGAAAAYDQVVNYVGNWWWNRDPIDARIIGNVQNNTQPAGGIPATAPVPSELALVTGAAWPTPPTTRPANWDTDHDGMPDEWEKSYGLNPSSAADWNGDADADGYINLVEYINEAGEFPAPAPIVFVGAANSRYAQITNWKTDDGGVTAGSNWQPSRFDEAQIHAGTVVVDAAGQHANILKIAANSGDNATLNISAGWLRVEQDVQIGGAGATAIMNLSGGELTVGSLSKGTSGTFNFTGGTLHAGTVNFSLTNSGGTLSPGNSIGQTHVVGDLTLASGAVKIELASASLADTLVVDGVLNLGGTLDIATLGGFTPSNGSSWQIAAAGGIWGQFSSVPAGYSVQQQGNNLVLFFGNPILAGDYNSDGFVNAADYAVWRSAMHAGGTLANETASPGVVDQADYDVWRANFGATSASSAFLPATSVPEPALAVLGAIAGIGWIAMKKAR